MVHCSGAYAGAQLCRLRPMWCLAMLCRLTGSASQNPTDTFSNESPETGKNLLQNDPVSRLEQSQFGNPGLR